MIINDDVVYVVYDTKSGKFYDGLHRTLIEDKYLYNTVADARCGITICPQTIDHTKLMIIGYNLTKKLGG